MIDAFKVFNQKTLSLVHQSVETGEDDIGFFRLNNETWKSLESISIDYAIMEKAENLVAVQLKSKWSDLGSWDTVWSELEKDEWGVATSKHAYSIDCTNTLLRSENPGQKIVGLGLNEIVAIAMPDAVLVTKKNRAQDVKKVVQTLRDNKVPQADTFPKDHRPWGWFESLTLGEKFQVKRICVKPNAALSLQSHKFRSEHWIVVEGTAKVTINKQIKKLTEGQSIYVPVGSIHRLENVGEIPMVLIEVQTGSYLGEDDIVRYEDLYSRK